MTVDTSIPHDLIVKLTEDRHWLHAHAELGYEEVKTAAYVKARLDALGIPYSDEIAETGIVAEITGRGDCSKVIGLRADMDALPIHEQTGVDYISTHQNAMHACGHDGHTAMLLGVAEILSKARDFDGKVRLIFQPAEENGRNGAERMLDEGLLERFPMDEVYGLHNWPHLPLGTVAALTGPLLASGSRLDITLRGQGAHGSQPQLGTPLVTAMAHVILGVDALAAQARDPQDRIVATLPVLEGSNAGNVLPDRVRASGSVRCLDQAALERFARDVVRLVDGIAAGFGAEADVIFQQVVPITANAAEPTALVAQAAADLGLPVETEKTTRPIMGSEDFSFVLEKVPGCYFLLGTGRGGQEEPLHSPKFDFNDDAIPYGVQMFHQVVRRALPLRN